MAEKPKPKASGRATASTPQPVSVNTGDPVIDAIINGLASSGGAGATDPLEILLGGDPTAPVVDHHLRWKDKIGPWGSVRKDPVTTVGDLFQRFFTFDGDELRDLQYNLFVGGFYGNADPRKIAWGVAGDDATYEAWQGAVVRSARFYAANKHLTVDDVIAMAGRSAGDQNERAASPTIVQLTDPATLADDIDGAAQRVLGRLATADEHRLFIAAIHDAERRRDVTLSRAASGATDPATVSALAQGSAPGSGTVEVTGVSPEARAETFARELDPVRADARKVVAAAEVLNNMLRGAA